MIINISHNSFKLSVYFLKCPAKSLAVLAHFKSGCSNSAGVCCLRGSEKNAVLKEYVNGLK